MSNDATHRCPVPPRSPRRETHDSGRGCQRATARLGARNRHSQPDATVTSRLSLAAFFLRADRSRADFSAATQTVHARSAFFFWGEVVVEAANTWSELPAPRCRVPFYSRLLFSLVLLSAQRSWQLYATNTPDQLAAELRG
jgi:hypothetical protein